MWGKVITFGPWTKVDKQNKVYAMYPFHVACIFVLILTGGRISTAG